MNAKRINIGCGMSPTPGWLNFDNSSSVKLARLPSLLTSALRVFRIIDENQLAYIDFCRRSEITWCDATKRIPCPDESVSILYSSHMLEHLDQREANAFLCEVHRVLMPGGIVRIAVPDLAKHVHSYLETEDGDAFMNALHVCVPNATGLRGRLRQLLAGSRHHLWMYDAESLCQLLGHCGFRRATALAAGSTTIPDPEPLDLHERERESLYVEASK